MLVFFALGLGGELRSMTHCGGGGGFDGSPCAILDAAFFDEEKKTLFMVMTIRTLPEELLGPSALPATAKSGTD